MSYYDLIGVLFLNNNKAKLPEWPENKFILGNQESLSIDLSDSNQKSIWSVRREELDRLDWEILQ